MLCGRGVNAALNTILFKKRIVEAILLVWVSPPAQAKSFRHQTVPPVKQIELERDSIGSIPRLMLGEMPVELEIERARQMVDVVFDHDLKHISDHHHARGFEKA